MNDLLYSTVATCIKKDWNIEDEQNDSNVPANRKGVELKWRQQLDITDDNRPGWQ